MNTSTDRKDRGTVCLVACTSRKGLYPAPAQFIYKSPLFAAARNYAESRCDRWFILSAKHGLLSPYEEIAPYDESLHEMDEFHRQKWAEAVYQRLMVEVGPSRDIIFLAGAVYRSRLDPLLRGTGSRTAAPMSSLGIGSQVAWLQKIAQNRLRLGDLDRLYRLLERVAKTIPKPRPILGRVDAPAMLPKRGIYFFFEPNEQRMSSPFEYRVTRIGTHSVSLGSKSTLWNRLRTHRGGRDGIGNHRGSIFRLHVGDALLRKSQLEPLFPTWGSGQSAAREVRASEIEIELAVSEVIGDMPVLWLEVGDGASADSDRAYLERNLIALISGHTGPIDLPSNQWLGRWSSRDAIRTSGLWNVNHVRETYESEALDVLECYVEIAEGIQSSTGSSLAPRGWRTKGMVRRQPNSQIDLL